MNLKILVVSWLGVEGLRHAPQTTTQTTTTTTTRGKVQRNEDKMRPMRRRRRYRGRALEFSTQAADTPKSLELSAEAAIRGVVQRAAEALRDGWRQVDLPSGAAAFQTLVSTENNASELSPTELAAAIERHRSIYGPLLAFDQVTEVSVTVESTNSAIATTRLVGDGESSIVSWTLSRNDRGQWLIDDVGLIQADAPLDLDLDAAFTPSPSWVAHTVLNALRKVDEPDPNHGCDVALSYVSDDNPSSSLTREIFRSYLDDENYPYGILTRWTDLRQETDVVLHDDGDDVDVRRASLDVTLIDDDDHDNAEWVISFELSKASSGSGGWKIDRVWCESF